MHSLSSESEKRAAILQEHRRSGSTAVAHAVLNVMEATEVKIIGGLSGQPDIEDRRVEQTGLSGPPYCDSRPFPA